MASGSESKIDTRLFVSTAQTVGSLAKQLDGYCREWDKAVGSLRGVWQGDTSDNIKNTAGQAQKSAADLIRALSGYQAALNELAGIYEKTEQNVQETGKSLRIERTLR